MSTTQKSHNPFIRAMQRINDAEAAGRDVEVAIRTRMNRCTRPDKLIGLYWACRDLGFKELARECKAKVKDLSASTVA